MLYFSIVPDGKSTAINPTGPRPYHLCVSKTLEKEDVIFDKEDGVCRLFTEITDPHKWQEETIALSTGVYGIQRYDGTQECILLEHSLFFKEEEYTIEFLTKRFADDLNTIMMTINEFDSGVLWLALLEIDVLLAKFETHTPAISEKEIGRLTRAIGSVIHHTERAISLSSKLIYAAHRTAECYPGTLHDVRTFTINKAYIYYVYLFFLPLKEFFANKVLPRGREHGYFSYLLDCCPSINIHTFTTTYDLMYAKESDNDMLDKLIKSPGRNTSKCGRDLTITPPANPSDVNISMNAESSDNDEPYISMKPNTRIE